MGVLKRLRIQWLVVSSLAISFLVFSPAFSHAETDVTGKTQLVKSRLRCDSFTQTCFLEVSLKNVSTGGLSMPLKVVLESINSPDVRVKNPDGMTKHGKPYFEYSSTLGKLSPGQTTSTKKWIFANPTAVKFDFTNAVFSHTSEPQVSAYIGAARGGVVRHPAGATLRIPPRALSRDSIVKIEDLGETPINPYLPVISISKAFRITLGGARASTDLVLQLQYPFEIPSAACSIDPEYVLLGTSDEKGKTLLKRAEIDPDNRIVTAELLEGVSFHELPVTFEVFYIPPVRYLDIPVPLLQVPYYTQSGNPWCSPSATAMLLNYHEGGPLGIVSNWQLAGLHGQDADVGSWPHNLLDDAGEDPSAYSVLHWDAELIPTAPFTDYIKRHVQGYNLREVYGPMWPDIDVPPQPVLIASEKRDHAAVAVRATNTSIWMHDSSGYMTAYGAELGGEQSWEDFREQVLCEECGWELYTLVVHRPPRPEAERKGSIVLGTYKFGWNSLAFYMYGPGGAADVLAGTWVWDGDPYEIGYYWRDEWQDLIDLLPDDPDYGNSVPLEYEQYFPGYFVYKAYIANITNEEQTYTIFVEVRDSDNNIFATDTHTVTALPHTWWSGEDLNRTNRIDGELHPVALYAPGIYTIQFRLIESGIVQDVKVIEFKVVD